MTHTRDDVTFPSGDGRCGAWLYRPEGTGRPPVVVMAHGFGATRQLRLDAYAGRFAGGHFDPYLEPYFASVVSDQIKFLAAHVPVRSGDGGATGPPHGPAT